MKDAREALNRKAPVSVPPGGPVKIPSMIALTLLACAAPALSPSFAADPLQDPAPPLTASSLKDEIDRSLRWLRGTQDAENGSYGNIAATTAVLMAFADSPRAYRAGDGPFVDRAVTWLVARQRPDGSFTDEEGKNAPVQTLASWMALDRIGGELATAASGKAAAFLGIDPEGLPKPGGGFADTEADFLLDLAASELATRHADGSWDEAGEQVHTTAGAVWRLSTIERELKRRGKASGRVEEKPLPAFDPADRQRTLRAVMRGAEFLVSAAEKGKWGFQGQPDPGISAMAAASLCAVPEPRPEHIQQTIDGVLDWLITLQKEDGAIHGGQLYNYVTCASVMAIAAGGRETDAAVLAKARAYLRLLQADEGDGYAAGDRYYGGVGYGGDERPDLSNLQMALEALATGDEKENAETYRKALAFLQRCQNRSESNDLVVARDGVTTKSGEDGGAGYGPGESKAGFIELPDGTQVPRSYGSMTYALLKGYLFAGLPRDDPRVQAAWSWVMQNYTLDVNPGFESSADPAAAYQGLFYYFHTMAKALELYGEEKVVDARGTEHAWRREIAGRIVAMQRQDGSWVNVNSPRWYEGNPVLATAYALSTLEIVLPQE